MLNENKVVLKINEAAQFKKKGLVFWRQVSAYKGISLFSEDVDGPILIDILYVQLISNSTPNATSPTLHSLYTVLTHYSSVKKRWSWSHAQLLPTTQIHTILSGVHELVQKKEKKTMTEWQDCFVFVFLILCSCPESQRLHQSLFHLPVSTFGTQQSPGHASANITIIISPIPVTSYW